MLVLLALALLASGSATVDLYTDGTAVVTYELTLREWPTRVSLNTLPAAHAVFTYSDDTPVPFEYNSSTGLLEFPVASQKARARLYHAALTEKRGLIWRLSLPPQEVPVSLLMPRGALIVSVEPKEFEAFSVGDRLLLKFPPSREIRVEYLLPPPSPLPPERQLDPFPLAAILIAGLLTVSLVLGYLYFRKGRGQKGASQAETILEGLDARDRAIMQSLERGELTAQDLMRETNIPKTPLYRRLEKLERMGLIEKVQRGAVTFYRRRQGERSQ
ncbi:MAG: winged helix-turn-helix transcriptional regulator [Acidilobaceae archaeon]|nr:winged helix-turn-helix transcriptional regulator [Acidilobaceae archaeon]MCX8165368.1 winged helix-turn-helix transcriptional regulator [Acidilobaceae archaeon]MDW7973794.1 helix-turn-helix domain-containing protein [Sulfolobales archaeon]